MISENRRDWVLNRTRFWKNFYITKLNMVDFSINVDFTNSLRTTAGQAFTSYTNNPCIIRLNTNMLDEPNFDQTIAHEVSHLIANRYYGSSQGHNDNWRKFFAMSGYNVSRCHSYTSVKKNKIVRYTYRCGCGKDLKITKNIITKMIKRNQLRSCVYCRSPVNINNLILSIKNYDAQIQI